MFFNHQYRVERASLGVGSASKESTRNAGDLDPIPGLGRSRGEAKGYPSQYSGLENSMDCIVHGVAKSQVRLSNFHFSFHLMDRREPLEQTRLQKSVHREISFRKHRLKQNS